LRSKLVWRMSLRTTGIPGCRSCSKAEVDQNSAWRLAVRSSTIFRF
jgi:hypothetical protein